MAKKPLDYKLDTHVFLVALLEAIEAHLYPAEDTEHSNDRTLSLRGANPKGNVSPLPLLQKLGQIALVNAVDRTFRMRLPDASALMRELESGFQATCLGRLKDVGAEMGMSLEMSASELAAKFDSLTPHNQDMFLTFLRPVYSGCLLCLKLGEISRRPSSRRDTKEELIAQPFEAAAMGRERARLASWAHLFQLRYWWTTLSGDCVREFLPTGTRPDGGPARSRYADVPEIELSSTVVSRETFKAQARYNTYLRLGAVRVVRPEGEFGKRRYVAFLFELPSGARVAVLDADKLTPSDHDAIYVFLIAKGAESGGSNWLSEAQLSKERLLSRKRGEGAFWGRHYHSRYWEENVRRTLAQLSDLLRRP